MVRVVLIQPFKQFQLIITGANDIRPFNTKVKALFWARHMNIAFNLNRSVEVFRILISQP